MFSHRIARGVAEGRITEAYFRWPSPQARPGARVSTSAGLIEVTDMVTVDPQALTDRDAARAGFDTAAGLRALLARHRGTVYRLGLTYLGEPDTDQARPVVLDARQAQDLRARLARLDVGTPRGPWTRQLLHLLREHPGLTPAQLAAEQNRPVARAKTDLWRLRQLGLIDSAGQGVRLSGLALAYLGES